MSELGQQITSLKKEIDILDEDLRLNPLILSERYNWSKRIKQLRLVNLKRKLSQLQADLALQPPETEPLPF